MRIFQEGDKLLNKHIGVFLPAILFIFPAALIKVLYMQFLFALQFDSPVTRIFRKLVLIQVLFYQIFLCSNLHGSIYLV
jgi:hypothetical protein